MPARRPARGLALATVVAAIAALAVAPALAPERASVSAANPGGGGGLLVGSVDPAGTVLIGTCFELWTDAGGGTAGTVVAGTKRCDQPYDQARRPEGDGRVDGTTAWTGVAPGTYVLRETLPPALASSSTAMYELAPDTAIRIRAGEVTRETLVHRPTGGLVIRKTDAAGKPLPGACFTAKTTADQTSRTVAACDGPTPAAGLPAGDGQADGILVLPGLTPTLRPTTYTLREIAPPGYAPIADQRLTVQPDAPLELTIPNDPGGGGGAPVIGLTLEIDSRIEITMLGGMPLDRAVATVRGRIALSGDTTTGRWVGSGSLVSETTSGRPACPGISISGAGTYDWVVRSATVAPDREIVVNMDSGPISESPDTSSTDTCNGVLDSTMNTWENLFFQIYRPRFQAEGFRVDGWKAIDPAAWTAGGVVAEATWTGSCPVQTVPGLPSGLPTLPPILECRDATTFRLVADVIGIGPPASGDPGSGGGGAVVPSPAVATADPGAPSGSPPLVPTPAGATECGLGGCDGSLLLPIVIGGILIVLGGGFLGFRFLGGRQVMPLPLQGPNLPASAGLDPTVAELSLDGGDLKLPTEGLDADKLPLEYDKLMTEPLDVDVSKVEPLDPGFSKVEPLDVDFSKVEPLDPSFSKVEPLDVDFSKVEPLDPSFSKVEPLPGEEPPLEGYWK
ncbi:MAG TPA: carboxypeptidase-like regulatory domain-containing protein [Candidatus Limnocylindrales bacterium]|nr:carboxypeptidase-like regulatory domain-containing protein [Candidatus Limnocylindrales bacterium]